MVVVLYRVYLYRCGIDNTNAAIFKIFKILVTLPKFPRYCYQFLLAWTRFFVRTTQRIENPSRDSLASNAPVKLGILEIMVDMMATAG